MLEPASNTQSCHTWLKNIPTFSQKLFVLSISIYSINYLIAIYLLSLQKYPKLKIFEPKIQQIQIWETFNKQK